MSPEDIELRARRVVERLALVLQAALMVRHGSPVAAEAFLGSRFSSAWGRAFGCLPTGFDLGAILRHAVT